MFFNSMDAGMAIGAYILGLIASGFGYRNVFFAGGILIIFGGILYFLLNRKKEHRETGKAILVNPNNIRG
ncbi:hypothetical protein JN080_08925 [Bacillus sp. EB600]|nr:hypothetical protein [Bacillus sp. EB600]MCQ6279370.1 hypothetical protein [Bacillus sp. EB600]